MAGVLLAHLVPATGYLTLFGRRRVLERRPLSRRRGADPRRLVVAGVVPRHDPDAQRAIGRGGRAWGPGVLGPAGDHAAHRRRSRADAAGRAAVVRAVGQRPARVAGGAAVERAADGRDRPAQDRRPLVRGPACDDRRARAPRAERRRVRTSRSVRARDSRTSRSQVARGERLALLGPSGAGKTSLLRAIAGLGGARRPGGSTSALADVSSEPPERRGVVYMHQAPGLFPHLSVRDNVAFPLEVRGVSRADARRRAEDLLRRVQLGAAVAARARRPSAVASGTAWRWRGRLAADPAVLLLDEPFAALDPELRADVRAAVIDLLAAYGRAGCHPGDARCRRGLRPGRPSGGADGRARGAEWPPLGPAGQT